MLPRPPTARVCGACLFTCVAHVLCRLDARLDAHTNRRRRRRTHRHPTMYSCPSSLQRRLDTHLSLLHQLLKSFSSSSPSWAARHTSVNDTSLSHHTVPSHCAATCTHQVSVYTSLSLCKPLSLSLSLSLCTILSLSINQYLFAHRMV
jgi:hypothetical protein